ncbi:MAG: hypothetical protein ACTSRZ_08010 [Promethearchaeota archaeon]
MKLKSVIEECMEIKDYLEDLVGDNEKIDLGIKFTNLKLVYILPQIYDETIDKVAKKFFKKENGCYKIVGEGQNCIEEIREQLKKYEKALIEYITKKNKENKNKR